jgi:ribosomal protein S18 acetylase RimI-like enzyme
MTSPAPRKPLPEGYDLVEGPPPLDKYLELRRVAGLSVKTAEQGAKALTGSWYIVHITFSPTLSPSISKSTSDLNLPESTTSLALPIVVGMGRVIGDGGWYFHIGDMAVLPDHQRKGLGDFIMGALLDKIVQDAPPNPYVNLISDPPARKLYARHGFVETASAGRESVGMERRF